jgi:hypothetical protein
MHYNKVKIIIEKAGKRKGFDAANELLTIRSVFSRRRISNMISFHTNDRSRILYRDAFAYSKLLLIKSSYTQTSRCTRRTRLTKGVMRRCL